MDGKSYVESTCCPTVNKSPTILHDRYALITKVRRLWPLHNDRSLHTFKCILKLKGQRSRPQGIDF